ncbi:MAG: PqiC family protein [Pseudomonadota bacterium]|nr:PqiC family protein [Pseudomonadota bacterium]
MLRMLRTCSLILAATALAACGSPAINYYVLDVEPGPRIATTNTLSIEIIDVEVPQYLERFQLLTRTAGNGLLYAEAHQWGEPLKKTLARVLAAHLSEVLGTADVSTPHARLASAPDLRVQVHIDRFERAVSGHIELRARWQVTDAATGANLETEQARFESAAAIADGDYAGLVDGMQDGFASLAQRIAESVALHAEASD